MANKNKPMSLEHLPDYIKNMQEHGGSDDCLVDMGTVIDNRFNYLLWTKRFAFAVVTCISLGICSFLAYDAIASKEITVLVQINGNIDPVEALPKIVNDSGGKILAVEQKEQSVFEVKVSTRRNKKLFLEWLNKNTSVKSASLQNLIKE